MDPWKPRFMFRSTGLNGGEWTRMHPVEMKMKERLPGDPQRS